MPPVKKYTSYFPQVPATSEQRLTLSLIANAQRRSITDVLRDAWDFYCASETIAVLLKQARGETKSTENAR